MYSGSVAATVTHSVGCAVAMASAQSTSLSPIAATACGRCRITQWDGWWVASPRAASSSGLYSITRLPSMPQEAETTTVGCASSMRTASSFGANPPNTTEWTAPSRAQASMATTASGTIGR